MKEYSPEFKAEAVKLVLEQNKIMAHVSRDLKIEIRTLALWVSRAMKGQLAGTFTIPPHKPKVLRDLDQIAREKQRDVLFVTFNITREEQRGVSSVTFEREPDYQTSCFDYERCDRRLLFRQWLYENNINFEECFGFGSEMTYRYKGQLYLDVPYDKSDTQYLLLRQYIENPDGSLKDPALAWYVLRLETAMKYKHHDDPEYWERL